jgi:hypothetical protein
MMVVLISRAWRAGFASLSSRLSVITIWWLYGDRLSVITIWWLYGDRLSSAVLEGLQLGGFSLSKITTFRPACFGGSACRPSSAA